MILTLRLVTKLTLMSLLVVRPTFAQRRSSPLDSTKTATVRRLLELTNAAEAIGKVMEATASVQRRADRDLPDAVWDVFLARARQICLNSRSEEHTSELQSLTNLVCRLLLE